MTHSIQCTVWTHKEVVDHIPELVMKTWISNLVCKTHFWNNLHQVRSKSKD